MTADASRGNDAAVDDGLLRRLACDPGAAYEEVVLQYQHRLFAFALRIHGNPTDAEEIVQDAFIRAYRALLGYEPDRIRTLALRSWLYRITLNVARNRRRGRRPVEVTLDDDQGSSADHQPAAVAEGPALTVERAEGERELATLIAALPPRYRAAVVLRHVAGLPYHEVASVLDEPLGTAKANVHRGVKMLRAAIEERDRTTGADAGIPQRRST